MNKNAISVEIPQEVATQVTAKLQEIKTLLAPYTAHLTKEDRMNLAKMGDKSLAFVSKVMEYVQTNPKFIPAMMNAEEFKKDFNANQQMVPFQTLADQISEAVKDTAILTGNEAYVQALYYYGNVKMFAKAGDPRGESNLRRTKPTLPKWQKIKPRGRKTYRIVCSTSLLAQNSLLKGRFFLLLGSNSLPKGRKSLL